MISLSKYFEKFKKIDGGRGEKIDKIIKSISFFTKIILKPEEILVKDIFFIEIKSSPLKRNEILMHKSDIIADLASNMIEVKDIV